LEGEGSAVMVYDVGYFLVLLGELLASGGAVWLMGLERRREVERESCAEAWGVEDGVTCDG